MYHSDRLLVPMAVMAGMAALCVLALAFMPKLAQANSWEARSITVQYHSTDLDTPEGVATLYRRIRGAAADVCSPFEGRMLEQKVVWNDCFSHAVANAVHTVNNEALTAYHWQRIRGWKPMIDAPTSLASQ
jgi:UrcA family protein